MMMHLMMMINLMMVMIVVKMVMVKNSFDHDNIFRFICERPGATIEA